MASDLNFENLKRDVLFGIRALIKNPGFTLIALVTLALGIGANTAIFSVVNAVLLKSLPYPQQERLVDLGEHQEGGDVGPSWPDFLDWQQQNEVFDAVTAYHPERFNLTGIAEPVRLDAMEVSAGFLDLTGFKPHLGRLFTPSDDNVGASPTVILTYSTWTSYFGQDPQIIGKGVTLNGVSYTVVGVLPANFWMKDPVAIFMPIGPATKDAMWHQRGEHPAINVLARLKPGKSFEQARSNMETIARRLAQQYPETNSHETTTVKSFYEAVVGDTQGTLYVLLAAVGFVLLTVCANLANLLLARGSARTKEMAIRVALGAGRTRLIVQVLTESIVLSGIGGLIGVALASVSIGPLVRLAPEDIPRLQNAHIDFAVLGFAVAISILAGLVFGVMPALQVSRPDLVNTLKQATRGSTTGSSTAKVRNAVLVTEVALALLLVTGAGLMIRSIIRVQQTSVGFLSDNLLTFRVSLPETKYPTLEQQVRFFKEATDRIDAVPGIRSAGLVRCLPMTGPCWDSIYVLSDRPLPPPNEVPDFDSNMVSADYFKTMGIPLIKGRFIDEHDTANSPLTVVVNETLARRMWPHDDPIGKQLKQGNGQGDYPYRQVVGVVGDVKRDSLDAVQNPEVFMPIAQHALLKGSALFVVRTEKDPMSMATAVTRQIHEIDKDQPVVAMQPMSQIVRNSIGLRKFSTLLLVLFGALALLLASVGIYGVMAYTVTLRMPEMGIRLALGAQPIHVFRLVIGQGITLALIGVAIGLLGSLPMTKFMSSLLFGITATDPVTFVTVALLLTATAALGSYVPARRTMKLDPKVALYSE